MFKYINHRIDETATKKDRKTHLVTFFKRRSAAQGSLPRCGWDEGARSTTIKGVTKFDVLLVRRACRSEEQGHWGGKAPPVQPAAR